MTQPNTPPVYPGPGFERPHWHSLNGTWQFSFADTRNQSEAAQTEVAQAEVEWTHDITAPFAPEAKLSRASRRPA